MVVVQASRARRRAANVLAICGVAVATWAPVAVVTNMPLAVAAAAGAVALCACAGVVDRTGRRPPAAFLVCVTIATVAALLHWTLR
jgi:drug/metabolite transporter (DMT)-like permease